jgi:hypothetical protein
LLESARIFHDEIGTALHELERLAHHREILKAPGYFRFGPTPKFRYSVIYQQFDAAIHVIAFAAPQRRPGYWKQRNA